MSDADLTVVDEEFEVPDESVGSHIVEHTKDRTTVVFELGGQEYTATKPKKTDEWFIELQIAMSSENTGQLLLEIDRFFKKIVGPEVHKEIRSRRLDDDDTLEWAEMSEVMKEIFELWSSEQDKPVRPIGRRSASSTGKRRTTRK